MRIKKHTYELPQRLGLPKPGRSFYLPTAPSQQFPYSKHKNAQKIKEEPLVTVYVFLRGNIRLRVGSHISPQRETYVLHKETLKNEQPFATKVFIVSTNLNITHLSHGRIVLPQSNFTSYSKPNK